MLLVDTHTHLYLPEFDPDRDGLIQKAMSLGVKSFFLPNIDSTSVESMMLLSDRFPNHCFPMMGLHPCSVKENYEAELAVVEHWLSQKKFYAIGEVGIDLYWDKTFLGQQQEAFKYQIKLAKQYDLPLVIHSRNAFNEAYELVAAQKDEKLKGIFHCFSGTKEDAAKVIALGGFKLGIGGVLTFKNSGLDHIVSDLDTQHLVLETDAPYLAPVPYRGKRNESTYLPLIAQKLADLKKCSIEEIAEITSANAKEVFNI